MMCNCINEVEYALKEKYGKNASFIKKAKTGFKWIGARIGFCFFIPFKLDGSKDAKRRKEYFIAEYCPFCGEKLRNE